MNKDELICRCEAITRGDIEQAIADGAKDLNELKRFSRASMGLCQGRTCRRMIERIFAEQTGTKLMDLEPATYRQPVRPIRSEFLTQGGTQMNWGRIITAMVTPMKEDGSLNIDQAVRLANYLTEHGTDTILAGGTTGESPTLEEAEKNELYQALREGVQAPLIVGIGTNSTKSSIHNLKIAEKIKADGVLVVVPYYNKPNQESLYEHFKAVAESTDLPIMLYNVPGRTGMNMTAETTLRLSEIKNIVATKEAAGSLSQLGKIIRDCPDNFQVYTGDDEQILAALSMGAAGVVSVASQVAGDHMKAMINDFLAGRVEISAKAYLELIGLFEALFATSNPIPVKAAMGMIGWECGPTRLPLIGASDHILEGLRVQLTKLNLLR